MTAEPFDSADLDAILELERSPGYALVVARIALTIEKLREDLERPGDPDRLRGQIWGLRLSLDIPGILKDQIRGELSA